MTLDILAVRSLPYLSRRNYYYEFLHLLPWGLLAGLVEGNIGAIVVAKTFAGSDTLIATASATPIGSLLASLVWGMLCVGRPKLRLATMFGSAVALSAATVYLTPPTTWGGWLFVAQMAAAQVFLSGVVTVRSALWKHNYPPQARGVITARLQGLRMCTKIGVLAAASVMFDYEPTLYRYAYPAVAVAGLLSMAVLQRLHVRHERTELRSGARGFQRGAAVERKYSLREVLSPRHVLGETLGVLRADHRYARYLAVHALLGVGIQTVMPVLVIVLHEAFPRYWVNAVFIEILPKALVLVSLRRWGRLFDRVTVLRFRVYSGVCATTAVLFGLLGTLVLVRPQVVGAGAVLPLAATMFALRAIFHGLHQGGGTLAWNLGHFHFADRHNAELYMGAHTAFTGLRGLVAPFLGVFLWNVIGWWVWVVGMALCAASVVAYDRLARMEAPDHQRV